MGICCGKQKLKSASMLTSGEADSKKDERCVQDLSLPHGSLGIIWSSLGLVGPVSVYCDWVR